MLDVLKVLKWDEECNKKLADTEGPSIIEILIRHLLYLLLDSKIKSILIHKF